MSEFVNFNKRDINLPPGCKDLFDLLQPPSQRKKLSFSGGDMSGKMRELMRKVKQGPFIEIQGKLSDCGKYIDMVLHSIATTARVSVSSLNRDMVFNLNNQQLHSRTIFAFVQVETKTTREQSLKLFLERHGLKIPGESKKPASFSPNLPVYNQWKIQPLPLESEALIHLVMDLFRETCGLTDSDKIEITYHETTYPPEVLTYFGS